MNTLLQQNITTYEQVEKYMMDVHGVKLYSITEPYLMKRDKNPNVWVGADHVDVTLLKRNGKLTTKYPRSHGIIVNGGHRPISLKTLISNIKENRPLFTKV